MTQLFNLLASSGADLTGNDTLPTLSIKNAGTGTALAVTTGTAALTGNATIAPLTVIASTASQAVLAIQGVFMSTASISVTAATSAFIIPVYHASQAVWGYVTASKGVV